MQNERLIEVELNKLLEKKNLKKSPLTNCNLQTINNLSQKEWINTKLEILNTENLSLSSSCRIQMSLVSELQGVQDLNFNMKFVNN